MQTRRQLNKHAAHIWRSPPFLHQVSKIGRLIISEISIMSVFWVDAMVTNAVDALGPSIKRRSNRVINKYDGNLLTGCVETLNGKELAERRMTKGGTIPQESVERF